jgi:hypothetical protein
MSKYCWNVKIFQNITNIFSKYCQNVVNILSKYCQNGNVLSKYCQNVATVLSKYCQNVVKILSKCQNIVKIQFALKWSMQCTYFPSTQNNSNSIWFLTGVWIPSDKMDRKLFHVCLLSSYSHLSILIIYLTVHCISDSVHFSFIRSFCSSAILLFTHRFRSQIDLLLSASVVRMDRPDHASRQPTKPA